jgi:hypothetical protein
MIHALRTVYNLSLPLTLLLAVAGFLLCGHGFLHYHLDLADLAAHNKLEHDASLVHADIPAPHPTSPDRRLLKHLLAYAAPTHGLTLHDFSSARLSRERLLLSPLNPFHTQIARGETALAWLLMKDEKGEVPLGRVEEWWGEERLPGDWSVPVRVIGLMDARRKADEVKEYMRKLREGDKGK